MMIIDGTRIAYELRQALKEKIRTLPCPPGLGVILAGNDPASHLYVALKEKASHEIGIRFMKKIFSARIAQADLLRAIQEFNTDPSIHAILIQLPLPAGFDEDEMVAAIDPRKDVDGFHPQNVAALLAGREPLVKPVLAQSIWALLHEGMAIQPPQAMRPSLKALLIGNSSVFTAPVAAYLKQKGVSTDAVMAREVSAADLKLYDILIVASGTPGLIRGADVKHDAIIIDVGTTRLPDGRVVGDVDFESMRGTDCAVTPVPGGVGPVTVAMLLKNTVELARRAFRV